MSQFGGLDFSVLGQWRTAVTVRPLPQPHTVTVTKNMFVPVRPAVGTLSSICQAPANQLLRPLLLCTCLELSNVLTGEQVCSPTSSGWDLLNLVINCWLFLQVYFVMDFDTEKLILDVKQRAKLWDLASDEEDLKGNYYGF